ncbi:hypothetical protein RF11_00617 [Thelohanellus kitauei]|uniref:Uncharacterized protein n=1 Tax=Thelohanellus kitauei TaxID=669202 RepID=A0A0C2MW49_THEKT|nr:hypothetical protein RF11_00617 [Thelohanellus kitauei]
MDIYTQGIKAPLPEFSNQKERPDPQYSISNENKRSKNTVISAANDSFEPNVPNDTDITSRTPSLSGSKDSGRNHRNHHIYIGYENNEYRIILFRLTTSRHFKNKDNNFMVDPSYTFIQESVEFDPKLFNDYAFVTYSGVITPIRTDALSVKRYRCLLGGCNPILRDKNKLKV